MYNNCDNDCRNCLYPECMNRNYRKLVEKQSVKQNAKLLRNRKFLSPEAYQREVEEYRRQVTLTHFKWR